MTIHDVNKRKIVTFGGYNNYKMNKTKNNNKLLYHVKMKENKEFGSHFLIA